MTSYIFKLGVSLVAFALVVAPALVTAQQAVTVSIVSPANNAEITVNQTVSFTGSGVGGNSQYYKYNWSWGDNTSDFGAPTMTHKYTATGSKTVRLVITDNLGRTGYEEITVNVVSGTTDTKPVISNIQVTNKTQTEATITWTTDVPATSRVIYDTVSHNDITGASAPNYGYAKSTIRDDAKVTSHSVLLTDLTPGTQYYFRVLSSK